MNKTHFPTTIVAGYPIPEWSIQANRRFRRGWEGGGHG
jgi:hypothetical protein